MKGFLTFTLAAGVAITTTSVAQAAGSAKGAMNVSKAPAMAQAPMGVGGFGASFDRTTLTRELDRLNQLLTPSDGGDEESTTNSPTQQKLGGTNWSY